MARSRTNEWEFQGEVLSWCNAFIASRKLGFDRATRELPNPNGKRSDVIIWGDHGARVALLEIELKTPTTPHSERNFQKDAISKAQKVGAPYVALWNMRVLAMYRTPAATHPR